MNKYKEAFSSAEQEMEEKSIEQLKSIVKQILQKKKNKEDERDKLDEEIKLLKQDIEDFKAGRLDKVKERHETDERCNKVFPIYISIVNQPIIAKPWTWTYSINQYNPFLGGGTITTLGTSGTNALYTTGYNDVTLCGTTTQTYTSGSYTVSGTGGTGIINL